MNASTYMDFLWVLRYSNLLLIVVSLSLVVANILIVSRVKGPLSARLASILVGLYLVRDFSAVVNAALSDRDPTFNTLTSTLLYLFTIIVSVFFMRRGFNREARQVL